MTIPIRRLLPNGKLVPAPISAHSLNEAGLKEPEGIYTVARTFQRSKSVLFDAHLDRLEESARMEHIPLHLDRKLLRQGLSQLLELSGFPESRFRITIPKAQPDQIWLAAEALIQVPSDVIKNGIKVATCVIIRPNPKAKSNAWVSLRSQAIKGISEQAYEGIICSEDGFLMEGFSSNFFAIYQGALYTAEENILHGITRRIVMQIAPALIPLQLDPIHQSQLPDLEEAFLTSSGRGIVPIIQVDQVQIADGTPGAVTHQLCSAYDRWVEENMQPIA